MSNIIKSFMLHFKRFFAFVALFFSFFFSFFFLSHFKISFKELRRESTNIWSLAPKYFLRIEPHNLGCWRTFLRFLFLFLFLFAIFKKKKTINDQKIYAERFWDVSCYCGTIYSRKFFFLNFLNFAKSGICVIFLA